MFYSLDLNRLPRSKEDLARKIDYTILKPTDTIDQILNGARNADRLGFRSIVVPPFAVPSVREIVRIPVTTVVSFPLGHHGISQKVDEVKRAYEMGAQEVDIVMNLAALKSGDWRTIDNEARTLTAVCKDLGLTSKFIIETAYLTRGEIERASFIIADAGGDYVKTNTGFGPRGVSVEDVIVIRRVIGHRAGIKASGGIRTALQAVLLLGFGADILGTSSPIEIYNEYEGVLNELR